MQQFEEKSLYDLAESIYDLDEKVYMVLGSSLGRVFNTGKARSVRELTNMMRDGKGYVLRNELALISNMARTIPDKSVRGPIMMEYDRLIKQVLELPTNQMLVDIIDEERAKMNEVHLEHRFSEGDHFIVCIERTYGCGGTGIGFRLADSLQINYYDDEIFDEVLNRLEAEKDHVEDVGGFSYHKDENDQSQYMYTQLSSASEVRPTTMKQKMSDFSRYHGLPKRDAVFFNQSHLLCEMAKQEDFVIMGRCAHAILLRNHIPHISILITAPFELRVQRVMKVNKNMTEKQVRRMLKNQDSEYSQYYKFFAGYDWKDADHYDISINSATYGLQGTVDMLVRMMEDHVK